MIRLNEVIKLEEKIRSLLEFAPKNYTPPICQFVNCSPKKQVPQTQKKAPSTKSKTSKKAKSAPEVNAESQNNTLFDVLHTQKSGTNAASRARAKATFNSLSYGPKEIYR